jgi:hypothetical protein
MTLKLQLVEPSTEERAFSIFEQGDESCRGPARPRPANPISVEPSRPAPRLKLGDVPLRVIGARHAKQTPVDLAGIFDPRLVESSSPDGASVEAHVSIAVERELLEALSASPQAGETIDVAYRRKEERIGAVFAGLTVLEARTLHRRLTTPSANDAIATQFSRLIESRRARLLAFLLDTRRRQAVTLARR